MPHRNKIDVQKPYNVYLCDYEILTPAINYDTSLGNLLQDSLLPTEMINEFAKNHNAIGIFTCGSKMRNANSVRTACICNNPSIFDSKKIFLDF